MSRIPSDESFLSLTGSTIKSIGKLLIHSRRCRMPKSDSGRPLIIMGNGPSLKTTIREDGELLAGAETMAVNFAANTPEFQQLRPKYYILADPHFFTYGDDRNVAQLTENINNVSWPMTLLIPFTAKKRFKSTGNPLLKTVCYNALGIEGFRWLTDMAYRTGLGMPRPRNVLIPAIMCGIAMGYDEIYIVGADHTWTRTLEVDDENHVISVQPHFYKEDDREKERVRKEYHRYPLHSIMKSFYIAFRAYHQIAGFAKRHHTAIYNSTPGSFIDAFPRRPLR